MTVIGIVLLAVGLVVVVSLTLADPVLLSRINGEPAEGRSGRHIHAPRVTGKDAAVVELRPRPVDGHGSRAA
ncbi:hypothetical protein [Planomonospora venezuelensis]|uniref:Uncharacterized protein n=1 Tax=Planomonospora venezuelensis TaxID=1999 RepID=A0A841D5N1_PLAVE|nr:hypothetical protein [Planomonospora venezuelensis]MBB5962756.1 hypothetical protein [Planomonospora venezuelensis]GIM99448.1 hypothetical protein Pve01_11070 [Planomonospora venezuelensis]